MRFFERRTAVAVLAAVATTLGASELAQAPFAKQDKDTLRVYFADVEGGQATLFVPPTGENLLVDTGNPGAMGRPGSTPPPSDGKPGRDAGRILEICKQAGVTKIDNLLITHYHIDHVGGLPEVAAGIPIGRFIDHGENRETADRATKFGYDAYQKILADAKYKHLVVKPGDVLPLTGMHVEIVSADGVIIAKPVAGAGGQNPACAASPEKAIENTENDRSVGMVITFGKLRMVDLGDLTWYEERPLMCPLDKIGKVDVYLTSHHGLDWSGSPALVNAIAPRVAIMNNGPRKGGAPGAWDIVQHSPRITALWQLHTAEADGSHNVSDDRIANLKGTDAGYSLVLTARKDASFAVTNQRTGETVEYGAK